MNPERSSSRFLRGCERVSLIIELLVHIRDPLLCVRACSACEAVARKRFSNIIPQNDAFGLFLWHGSGVLSPVEEKA